MQHYIILLKSDFTQSDLDAIDEIVGSLDAICEVFTSSNIPFVRVQINTAHNLSLSDFAHLQVRDVIRHRQQFVVASKAVSGFSGVYVDEVPIGQQPLMLIAGPCSVESESQLLTIAHAVKRAGANFLRGGAFKPRTSPYSFRGLGIEGLQLLAKARAETGLRIVTEVMSPIDIEMVSEYADVLQVGARNCQNFALLDALAKQERPVLLKRGFGCTLEELLLSAEYLLQGKNHNVLLCERGIRSFETSTRFTFDINAVATIKHESFLPVIADPSHATGCAHLVAPIAKAAIAAGADGLMIEVHDDPSAARSDGVQSLTLEQFAQLTDSLRPLASVVGRTLGVE